MVKNVVWLCFIWLYKLLFYVSDLFNMFEYMQGTRWRKAKSMQAQSPKNGSASQRKPKKRFKRCRDARAVLQQACEVELWLPPAIQRHVYSQQQCTGPWAQTPAPPDIKVDLLPYYSKQLRPGLSTYITRKQRQIINSYWLGRKTTKNVFKSY